MDKLADEQDATDRVHERCQEHFNTRPGYDRSTQQLTSQPVQMTTTVKLETAAAEAAATTQLREKCCLWSARWSGNKPRLHQTQCVAKDNEELTPQKKKKKNPQKKKKKKKRLKSSPREDKRISMRGSERDERQKNGTKRKIQGV